MYNGLTTADKTALLELKKCGAIETKIYHVVDIPNVDEALAHIAEMESKPLTWNERINQMTVEEKAEFLDGMFVCVDGLNRASSEHCGMRTCKRCWIEKLTSEYYSPYTEGETK